MSDLASSSGRNFDNEAFWDGRYRTNPSLGSGLGSRGDVRVRKVWALEAFIRRHHPATLLDLGCGDFSVVGPLVHLVDAATGVDISSVVVRNNAARFPVPFVAADLTDPKLDLGSFDLVTCIDVAIHQPDKRLYDRLLDTVVRHSRSHIVVSGYEHPPQDHRSEITFFHEPLTESVAAHRCGDIEVLDEYRETVLVAAKTPPGRR